MSEMYNKYQGLAIIMMAKPNSDMEGTICKNCQRAINDHLPEELDLVEFINNENSQIEVIKVQLQ